MSVIHMVWFKWKAETSKEQIDAAMNALQKLKGAIPEIQEISVGVNFTERSKGFTHGLLVKLPSKEALPVYADHPAHLAVVKDFIAPIREDIMALDYTEGQF